MSDNSDAKDRIESMTETERDTKIAYVVVAGLFAANAAGVFSTNVPSAIFAVAFIALLLVDAAT